MFEEFIDRFLRSVFRSYIRNVTTSILTTIPFDNQRCLQETGKTLLISVTQLCVSRRAISQILKIDPCNPSQGHVFFPNLQLWKLNLSTVVIEDRLRPFQALQSFVPGWIQTRKQSVNAIPLTWTNPLSKPSRKGFESNHARGENTEIRHDLRANRP